MKEPFLSDFRKSKRPVLLIGGGARWAAEAVRQLGQQLGVPCVPTWNAVDIITSDYEFYRGRIGTYGMRSGNFTLQNADLVLAIGCRFSGRITGGQVQTFCRAAKVYAVDIDAGNLKYPTIKLDVPICEDALSFVHKMIEMAKDLPKFCEWLGKTKEWLVKYPTVLPGYYKNTGFVHPYVFIKALSDMLTENDIIVADCGGNVVVTYQAFETKWGQRLISSNGNSPMGFSFAGAIGACLARPDKRVVCIIGDGGFNMNIQELQTTKNYNIRNLKVFIMNNHIYGITRQFQDTNFGSRYEASGPKGYNPPNFLPIVHAYGIQTAQITHHDWLEERIRAILNFGDTIVCDVNNGSFAQYEPRIFGWNTPIEDMYPYLPRNEFSENMIIEPVEGWENPVMPPRKRIKGDWESAQWERSKMGLKDGEAFTP